METVRFKTIEGEILLNIHDDNEIDIEKDEYEDTIDLHKMVNLDETE